MNNFLIVKYFNVIQYDDMGYPLRLVIDNKGKQLWIDTEQRENDVVLTWSNIEQLDNSNTL